MDRAEYRRIKFGSAERSSGMDTRLQDAGHGEGIELAFEKIGRTPNTLNAHRLIWLAAQHGRQIEMVDTLFKAYFTDGRDIATPPPWLIWRARLAWTPRPSRSSWLAMRVSPRSRKRSRSGGRSGSTGCHSTCWPTSTASLAPSRPMCLANVIERVVALEEEAKRPQLVAWASVPTARLLGGQPGELLLTSPDDAPSPHLLSS